jgi:hypothetical protein
VQVVGGLLHTELIHKHQGLVRASNLSLILQAMKLPDTNSYLLFLLSKTKFCRITLFRDGFFLCCVKKICNFEKVPRSELCYFWCI